MTPTSEEDRGVCDNCGAKHPMWALYERDEHIECGLCINLAAGVEVPEITVVTPWATERGLYLKAERNIRLNETMWVLLEDSPCDDTTVAAYKAYRRQLNEMTLLPTPEDWVWPDVPPISYKETTNDDN